jgi:hypothetical protein
MRGKRDMMLASPSPGHTEHVTGPSDREHAWPAATAKTAKKANKRIVGSDAKTPSLMGACNKFQRIHGGNCRENERVVELMSPGMKRPI